MQRSKMEYYLLFLRLICLDLCAFILNLLHLQAKSQAAASVSLSDIGLYFMGLNTLPITVYIMLCTALVCSVLFRSNLSDCFPLRGLSTCFCIV